MSSWRLGADQAAALLAHRCRLIAYEDDIDEAALRAGELHACLAILRYLFTGFSEALTEFCRASGECFSVDMTDRQLIGGVLGLWHVLSPQQPDLGNLTVDKMLQSEAWGMDRLLFTLQCVFVCSKIHIDLISQRESAWLHGVGWTNTSPQQQFDDHPAVGTESQKLRVTVAWMAQAYREQLDSLDSTLQPVLEGSRGRTLDESQAASVDGAAEQEAWLARVRGANEEGSVAVSQNASSSTSCFGSASTAGTALLAEEAREIYAQQLEQAGLPRLAMQAACIGRPPAPTDEEPSRQYRWAMAALEFPPEPNGSVRSMMASFDDAELDTSFLA